MKIISVAVVVLLMNIFISACRTSSSLSSKTKTWGSEGGSVSPNEQAPPPPLQNRISQLLETSRGVVNFTETRGINFDAIVAKLNHYRPDNATSDESVPTSYGSVFAERETYCEHSQNPDSNQIKCTLKKQGEEENSIYTCSLSMDDFGLWFNLNLERNGTCPSYNSSCNGKCSSRVLIPHLLPLNSDWHTTQNFNIIVKWCAASGNYLDLRPDDISIDLVSPLSEGDAYYWDQVDATILEENTIKGMINLSEAEFSSTGLIVCGPL